MPFIFVFIYHTLVIDHSNSFKAIDSYYECTASIYDISGGVNGVRETADCMPQTKPDECPIDLWKRLQGMVENSGQFSIRHASETNRLYNCPGNGHFIQSILSSPSII